MLNKVSPEHLFMEKFYPDVSVSKWNNWQWQVKNRLVSYEGFYRIFTLSEDEKRFFSEGKKVFKASVTPYLASVIYAKKSPLLKCSVPCVKETDVKPWETEDPLKEDINQKAEGLIHRYKNRALFLVTDFCPAHCRFCTRSRLVGKSFFPADMDRWEKALDYIKEHKEIRDVLVSGGEPFTLEDEKIDWLLSSIRSIGHVKFLRMGTKSVFTMPMRFTENLLNILEKHKPWISIHATHPDEFTESSTQALNAIADAGIPMGSQTVLLKGVNDNPETMMELMHGLTERRVKPYYLFQCEQTAGTSHFRTSIEKGFEIIRFLRKNTTGYAVPDYVLDVPGKGGKIPLTKDNVKRNKDGSILIEDYTGGQYRYIDM